MRRVAAALLMWIALSASSAVAQDAPRVELPLGPFVREGRPVVVRAPGAEYVTLPGVGTPMFNPTGARGDEFVLPRAEAPGGVLSLSVSYGEPAESTRVQLVVRVLPAAGEVVGRFGSTEGGAIALPIEGLPTVREAWLWLDRVEGDPPGVESAVLAGLAAWRAGPRPGTDRAAFEPLTHSPSEDAFIGAALAEQPAPGLPSAIVRLLVVLAVTEVVLALVTARRGRWGWAQWVGYPSLAVAVWLVQWGDLPSSMRATAVVLEGPEDRLVVVRLEARGNAPLAWVEVPEAASWHAFLRFSPDDEGATIEEEGRAWLVLEPGESRLLAYRLPPADAKDRTAARDVPAPLVRWIEGLGLQVTGEGGPVAAEDLPSSDELVVVPALSLRVAPGK